LELVDIQFYVPTKNRTDVAKRPRNQQFEFALYVPETDSSKVFMLGQVGKFKKQDRCSVYSTLTVREQIGDRRSDRGANYCGYYWQNEGQQNARHGANPENRR
jgi:hypothetical protein